MENESVHLLTVSEFIRNEFLWLKYARQIDKLLEELLRNVPSLNLKYRCFSM